jgi:CRISPR-associated protein Cas1
MLKKSVFIGNKAKITTQYEQLFIKTDEREGKVPIADLGFLIIDSQQVYISIPAINKLIDNNVSVIFCDDKHLPSSMLLNLNGHHLQQAVFSAQIKASEPLKKQLWQQTIKKKIKHQALLLDQSGITAHPLHYYASKVLSGDSTNREAMAAAYYWKKIFQFDFKREREGVFPNVFLNYGYAVLRAAVARALSGSGLLNTLGIHHRNQYNAFALADDIMEPFRPLVDKKVMDIIRIYDSRELTTEIKAELINITTETVYFDDYKSPLMVALQRVASSLQQCFTGEKRKINYPLLWN